MNSNMTGKMIYHSPLGRLLICADMEGICALRMAGEGETASAVPSSPLLAETARQLDMYFGGRLTCFDLPLSKKGSPFEQAVWAQLRGVPYGEVRTYGQIAAQLGMHKAARAVGRACGANPVLIITPCHRVIGAGGRLTGFAAGVDAKKALLAFEGHKVKNDRIILL